MPLLAALALAVIAVVAVAAKVRAFWLSERRARTVYPARDATALLSPARKLIQRPAALVRRFGVRPGQRVLELGPGPGYFTVETARLLGDAGFVVAADLQPGMIEALQRRLVPHDAARVRGIVADATRLPLASGSFDCVYLNAVLGEIPDPDAAARELRRVLRPGGVVAFSETVNDPDYVRQGELKRICFDAGLGFLDQRRQLLGYTMRFTRSR